MRTALSRCGWGEKEETDDRAGAPEISTASP
jgi:hypothetical protein